MRQDAVVTRLEDVLDQLYYSATSEREKGDKFERLMLAFFKTDVQWADRFADVWMWTEWPERHGRRDNGIDLVAVDRATNETVAIQCKFYDPAHYLTKPDIDSFLAESGKDPFAQRLIVSTTDRWNANAEASIEHQRIPVQSAARRGGRRAPHRPSSWDCLSFDRRPTSQSATAAPSRRSTSRPPSTCRATSASWRRRSTSCPPRGVGSTGVERGSRASSASSRTPGANVSSVVRHESTASPG